MGRGESHGFSNAQGASVIVGRGVDYEWMFSAIHENLSEPTYAFNGDLSSWDVAGVTDM